MKKLTTFLGTITMCAALAHATPAPKQAECVERFEVSPRPSLYDELSALGKPAAESAERARAVTIDPAKHKPAKVAEGFKIDGAPLLYLAAGPQPDAVVDARWFSDLAVADATRLTPGARLRVGQLTPAARGKIGGRELTRFLIAAGLLKTYWHAGANLCLEKEDQGGGGYRALYSGIHTYYTNKKNERAIAFAFELAGDGTITVAAR